MMDSNMPAGDDQQAAAAPADAGAQPAEAPAEAPTEAPAEGGETAA
jgi:hypothetical protein